MFEFLRYLHIVNYINLLHNESTKNIFNKKWDYPDNFPV
jgi:hypothetical protein